MKRAELKALELSDEVIDKIMKMNGADIEAEKEKRKDIQEKLDNANTQLSDANEKLKGLDGKDDTIKDLQEKVQKYVDAEKQRKEQEQENAFTQSILDALPQDREFTSDYVKNGIIADIKAKINTDKTLGVKEVFEELTKDKEGIFKNKQQQKIDIPGANTDGNTKFTREEIERMTPDEINKNWADIKASGIL